MHAEAEAWLCLLQAARGETRWRSLLEVEGSAAAVLALTDRQLAAAEIPKDAIARLRRPDPDSIDVARRWLDQPGHALVTFGSARYPQRLAQIPDAPLALWTIGERLELLAAPQLAIVGSRNATAGGRATAEQFGQYLSRCGLTITSGLAVGIDAAGHEGALRGPGSTIAVFGCGIDVVYPHANRDLAGRIAESGLLVSEYPPGVPPLAWRFPQRNRIIAGLSLGTLVVEASRRSGALGTAKAATEYDREVFAVPGSIHSAVSRGCHQLIRQGAKLVEEGADILVELAPQLAPELELAAPPAPFGDGEPPTGLLADEAYRKLLKDLGFEPVPIGRLAAVSGLTTAEVSSMLLQLELEGLVEALPGGRYCRTPERSR